jgi:uncharacterized membrane protein
MKSALIILFITVTLLNVWFHMQLPDRIATHFGAEGKANGWSDKTTNTLMMQGVYLLFLTMFLGIPKLIGKTADRLMNLPNKGYWLKPENRETAREMTARFMYEMGIYLFLFFAIISQLTFEANMNPAPQIDNNHFMIVLVAFFGLIILWMIRLFQAFRVPKSLNDT